MLKVMRDSMRYLAWTLWAVIAVFILFVFVDFGGVMPSSQRPSAAAATVGSTQISYREFQQAYQQLEQQLRSQLGDELPEQFKKALPMQALNRLISDAILIEEAERAGITVSDAAVRAAILEIPAFLDADGRFVGADRYQRTLRSLGYTPDGFENAVRRDLVVARLQSALRGSVFIPEPDVERAYREEVDTATVRYVDLPYSSLATEVEVADDQLSAYLEAHPEEFRFPERRIVDLLLVDQNRLRSEITPTPEQVQAFYDEHVDEYRQPEQVRARHILVATGDRSPAEAESFAEELAARIRRGEDFAAVAAEASDDKSNADRGGDLGYFGRGQMVKPFEDAAFGAPIGELVGPVRSPFGVHLIRVEDRREARLPALAEVQPQVEARLQSQGAEKLAQSRGQALATRLDAGETDFATLAAEDQGVVVETTSPFGRDDVIPRVGRSPELSQAVFDLGVGQVTGAINVPRGVAIARLSAIEEPRLPSLDEVRPRVLAAARQAAQKELAVSRLAELRRRLADGADFTTEAEALGLKVKDSGSFGRRGNISGLGLAPDVAEAALALDEGDLGEPIARDRGAVLFRVVERGRFDADELSMRREEIRERLRGEELQRLLATMVDRSRRSLGVSYDRQLLEQFDLLDQQTS